jgi:autotransporter-associated beta strand protein
VTLPYAIVLAAGANLGFNCNLYINAGISYDFTCNGVISGLGDLYKTNFGTLFLNKANTYTGSTTIQWGPLALGANGSISNSATIDVRSDATFDVSAVTGGFVLGAAQTLKGTGTVAGNVTANGTLAPEALATFGNLTFNDNLALGEGARLSIKVNRAGFPTSDTITVFGTSCTNAGAGTVQVINGGGSLQVGDSFTVFNQPVVNGQALSVVGAGAVWTNKLAVDGSIAVVSILPPPAFPVPRLTSVTVAGPVSVKVTWTNVVIGSNYWLQFSPEPSTSDWTDVSPVTAWGTTASQMDGIPTGVRQRYYRVRSLASGALAATARITSVARLSATTLTLNYTNTVAGTNYVVQYTTNLSSTNWTPLSPVTASGTSSATTDSLPAGTAQRFYRVYGQF